MSLKRCFEVPCKCFPKNNRSFRRKWTSKACIGGERTAASLCEGAGLWGMQHSSVHVAAMKLECEAPPRRLVTAHKAKKLELCNPPTFTGRPKQSKYEIASQPIIPPSTRKQNIRCASSALYKTCVHDMSVVTAMKWECHKYLNYNTTHTRRPTAGRHALGSSFACFAAAHGS